MIDPDNIYHVYPLNDTYEHMLECIFPAIGDPVCKCACKPRHDVEGDGMVIIHNSFDGREGVDWVNEILENDIMLTANSDKI